MEHEGHTLCLWTPKMNPKIHTWKCTCYTQNKHKTYTHAHMHQNKQYIQHILQRTSARQHLKLSKIYLCICLQFTHMHENNTYHNNTRYKQTHRQTMHDAYAYTYLHTLVWPHICKYTHRWYVPAQTQPHMYAHKYAIELWELMQTWNRHIGISTQCVYA